MTIEKTITAIEDGQLPGYWIAYLGIFFKNLCQHLRNEEF